MNINLVAFNNISCFYRVKHGKNTVKHIGYLFTIELILFTKMCNFVIAIKTP